MPQDGMTVGMIAIMTTKLPLVDSIGQCLSTALVNNRIFISIRGKNNLISPEICR